MRSAKINGHEPLAYLSDILDRLPTARMRDLDAMPTDSSIITPK